MTSFEIIKFGDVAIEILEEVEVENKEELHRIEGQYQRECDEIVNKNIAGRKYKEWYKDRKQLNPDYNKEVYQRRLELNPDYLKEQYRRALELHPNLGKEQYKRRLELNPDYPKEQYQRILQKNPNHCKEYYQKYGKKNNERIICDCGCISSRNHLSRHQKTQTHIDKVLELQSEELRERCQIRFFYNNQKEVKKFYIYASMEDVKRSIDGKTRNPAELFSIL